MGRGELPLLLPGTIARFPVGNYAAGLIPEEERMAPDGGPADGSGSRPYSELERTACLLGTDSSWHPAVNLHPPPVLPVSTTSRRPSVSSTFRSEKKSN